MITPDALARSPNALAPHYSRFRVADRLPLTGHSHQAWPDVARDAQVEAFDDAAACVDDKWDRAFARADEVRAGFRRLLGEPTSTGIALGASTHDLVVRFLSALDVTGRRRRLVTSTGEFHTLRRQLARLAEAGVDVEWVAADPVDTLAERMAAAVDDRTAAVLVSAVLYETARIVPHLGGLSAACRAAGAELLVDAYHALGVVPFPVSDLGLAEAWIVGGGYKYLQLGEGNCFLRLPAHADRLRPVVTGWFAEFDVLAAETDGAAPGRIAYGPGAQRFAGATYDPTSHYRGARVFRFFADQGLTPALLRRSYVHQLDVLMKALRPSLVRSLKPRIAEITDEFLDQIEPDTEVDFVTTLGRIPAALMTELVGVPPDMRDRFIEMASAQMQAITIDPDRDPDEAERVKRLVGEFHDYCGELVADRRARGGGDDDLASIIASSTYDGGPVPDGAAISYIHTFVNAGETTRAHLSFMAMALAENPDQRQLLAERPELISNAVEEGLRYYPLNWSGCRTATEDIELGGELIRKDDYVMMAYASANRDEDVWERPDQFDVTRSFDQDHQSFGHGEHSCPGALLARTDSAMIWERVLARFPDWELAGTPQRWANPFLQGLSSLPLRFHR